LTLRELVTDIPDLKHLCVLERVTRIGLNPLFKGSAFGLSAVIFVQTHTPVSRSVEDFVFHLVRTQGAHQKFTCVAGEFTLRGHSGKKCQKNVLILKVQSGRAALSGSEGENYRGLEGRVANISPDTIQDKVKAENYFYRVFIQTDSSYLKSKSGKQFSIAPGMPAFITKLKRHLV
jgi:hypothetical protein